MKEYSFNILGSCVVRDIFRIANDQKFLIKKYLNNYCPLYQHEDGLNINLDAWNKAIVEYEKNFEKINNFLLRCKYIDLRHDAFNYIQECKSDFLLLDCVFVQYKYLTTNEGIYCTYTTEKFMDFLIEKNIIKPKMIQKFSDAFSKREIEERMRVFCNKIKKIYNVENIVLFKLKYGNIHFDFDKKEFNCFDNNLIEERNRDIEFCQNEMIRNLSGACIIEIPNNIICNTNHKWGKAPSHYIDDIYHFFYNALDLFVQKKQNYIHNLREEVDKSIASKFNNFIYKNFKKLLNEKAAQQKMYNNLYWENITSKFDACALQNIIIKSNNNNNHYFQYYIAGIPHALHYELLRKENELYVCLHCENVDLQTQYKHKFEIIKSILQEHGIEIKNLFYIDILTNKFDCLHKFKFLLDSTLPILFPGDCKVDSLSFSKYRFSILFKKIKFKNTSYTIIPSNNRNLYTISLKSNSLFLRHNYGLIKEMKDDGSALFKEDSSFYFCTFKNKLFLRACGQFTNSYICRNNITGEYYLSNYHLPDALDFIDNIEDNCNFDHVNTHSKRYRFTLCMSGTKDYVFAIANVLIGIKKYCNNLFDNIVIFHDGFDIDDINNLHKIFDYIKFINYNSKFNEYLADILKIQNDTNTTFWSHCVYASFEAFGLLEESNSVLWLDGDTIILRDISPIQNFGPIAFREEVFSLKWALNLEDIPVIKCVNSGVFYINDCIDFSGIKDLCYKYARDFAKINKSPDESIITYVLHKKNIHYNLLPAVFNSSLNRTHYNNFIIHQTSPRKFWKSSSSAILCPEWLENNNIWISLGGKPYSGKNEDIFLLDYNNNNLELRLKHLANIFRKRVEVLFGGAQEILNNCAINNLTNISLKIIKDVVLFATLFDSKSEVFRFEIWAYPESIITKIYTNKYKYFNHIVALKNMFNLQTFVDSSKNIFLYKYDTKPDILFDDSKRKLYIEKFRNFVDSTILLVSDCTNHIDQI